MRPVEAKVTVDEYRDRKAAYEEALSIVAGVEIKLVEVEVPVEEPVEDEPVKVELETKTKPETE